MYKTLVDTPNNYIYYYKNQPYKVLANTKIKLNGEWKECVVYHCLYTNPDGMIWVRSKEEFYELFKII